MKEAPKTVYDALLRFSWNEHIPENTLRSETNLLLSNFGISVSKCDIYVSYDVKKSYVKIMPNRSLSDFSPKELEAFSKIADACESNLKN